MANDERARVALYERLDEALGRGPADTLMGYLPPVGWADVVTKHDLVVMEARLEAQFERALRQVILAMVTTTIASVGAAVGLTQLLT